MLAKSWLLAFSFAIVAPAFQSPLRVRIDARSGCVTCRLETVQVATLRPPDGAASVGHSSQVVRDSRGRFLVLSDTRQQMLLFDGRGTFLREVGRAGRGPGEFRSIASLMIGPGDSLFVFDLGQRLHVFDSSLVLVRSTASFLTPQGPFALEGGRILGRVNFGSADSRAGYPAYIIDDSRSTAQPVGRKFDVVRNGRCGDCDQPTVYPSPQPNRLWLAPANRYEIDEIATSNSSILRQIAVDGSAWFTPWDSAGRWATGVAPRPSTITSVSQGDDGLLWILGVRTPAGWTPTPAPQTPDFAARVAAGVAGSEVASWQAEIRSKLESVVDVIDLNRGQLLGTLTVRRDIRQVAPGVFYSIAETQNLDLAVEVFQVVVRRQAEFRE